MIIRNWFSRIKYNRAGTVRVKEDGTVQRKYRRKSNGQELIVWLPVDYQTLSRRDSPRKCPKGYVRRLTRTAV